MKPWTFFLAAVAGWMNRRQQEVIEYLKEENRVLREHVGRKRILLNDEQKRRLATKGKTIGRKLLERFGTLFNPDTILRWHRELIARKYDYSHRRRPGPLPKKANMIRDLVLRMAGDNPSWGYGRIYGEIKGLGYDVHWQTVRRIMRDHGLLDDPDKPDKNSWKTFLRSHWESFAACDFFTVEAWTPLGLKRFLVLFVIDLATRRVRIAGIDPYPHEKWMLQQARNITDPEGILAGKRFLIHDRDPLFTRQFRQTCRAAGIRCLRMPKRSPNLNAYAESFVRAIKYECLNKMILFGERHVRHVIEEYVDHYNNERPHQGIGNRRINKPQVPPPRDGPVACRERLGGLLRSYHREAA
jgi:putative transposase